MKNFLLTFWVAISLGISGCIGWGDYMKFPPSPSSREIWLKEGKSEMEFAKDIGECRAIGEALHPPVKDYSHIDKFRHAIEHCMLGKGYTFRDAIPSEGGKRYCSSHSGGPACKSIGR
jgi:hypothetical protein